MDHLKNYGTSVNKVVQDEGENGRRACREPCPTPLLMPGAKSPLIETEGAAACKEKSGAVSTPVEGECSGGKVTK